MNTNQEKKQEAGAYQLDELVTDISNNITTRLSDLMSKLLNSTQDTLFNMSDEADNNEDKTRYFELMNQLRTLKPAIAESFNKNIKAYLVPARDFELKQKQQKTDENDELSLVGQDEMEGIVLVKGIGERSAGKYREQLSHLGARLDHLALKTGKTFKSDALAPTNFCQAFDDALTDNFDNTNKKLLFSIFDAEVAHKLDALYDSINNRLIDADILPQIRLHMDEKKSHRPHPKPPQVTAAGDGGEIQQGGYTEYGAYNGDGYAAGGSAHGGGAGGQITGSQTGGPRVGQPANQAGGSNVNGFAMTAAPGGNYRNINQNLSPLQMTDAGSQGTSAAAPPAGNYAGGSNMATAGEHQNYTAGMPVSQVSHVLSDFIGTAFTPDKSAADNDDFYPQTTPQHFGHDEVIQALSSIQSLPQFNQQAELHFDGEVIKQALLEAIAKTSGGAVTKNINQIAEKTIDFIELIFDAIIDDESLSDAIKALLLRLQIPIIKASMSDQEFFIYDEHPARVLLDTIADTGVGINNHTDNVYIYLDKIVTSILGEYKISTETFQSALDNLNTYVTEQEKITRAREEEEQKKLLRKHARATILKSLRATTTEKTLPEAVHPLILKRWPTLMFNHYLTKGKENDEWINIVLTLRKIIDSVQAITSAEHLARITSDKDDLFAQTERYLNISSNSKKDVKNIMGLYVETVQQHIVDANFTAEEVSIAQETISNTEPVEKEAIEEVIDKPTIPPNIMPGAWFKLFMGENKITRRCKLSVILVEDAKLMFVNHQGELIIEKSFDDFNKDVASHRTKMIMGHSAFENAFKTVINRLN